jgi:hypothetical protein
MSDEIRDVTTITFSGPRFDDAGLELDVLSELLAYRKLLVETAKELWRSENRERQRLPKGFEDSIRLKFYSIEPGSAVVPIKRIVSHDDSLLFEPPPRADEIDEAAQLIDETIAAVSEDRAIPDRMPKTALPLLASLGENLREGETIKTRAVRSPSAAEFTCETRTRVERMLDAVYEDRVEIVGRCAPRMSISATSRSEIPTGRKFQRSSGRSRKRKLPTRSTITPHAASPSQALGILRSRRQPSQDLARG